MRAIAATIALLWTGSALAEASVDLSAYPEMSKDRALPLIASSLRNSLTDAGSVSNFMLCTPPVKIKWKEGKPVRWTFLLSLNTKNSYGGYAGTQGMAAIFYADKPVETFSLGMPLRAKDLARCTRVPDAEIQRLIQDE